MKLTLFILAIVAALFWGCSRSAAPPDSIDRLMVEVAHETVASYPFQPIDLPATASPEQLVSALPKRGDIYWKEMQITSYKILTVRAAHSGPNDFEHYTAVLLDTNAGQKIVLLQPMSARDKWMGWYYKIYDAR
jgi:hypothetical protein